MSRIGSIANCKVNLPSKAQIEEIFSGPLSPSPFRTRPLVEQRYEEAEAAFKTGKMSAIRKLRFKYQRRYATAKLKHAQFIKKHGGGSLYDFLLGVRQSLATQNRNLRKLKPIHVVDSHFLK